MRWVERGRETERKRERKTGVREGDGQERNGKAVGIEQRRKRGKRERWLQNIPIFPLPGILLPRAPLASASRVGLKQACLAGLLISVSHLSRIQPLSLTSSLLAQNIQTWENRFSELEPMQGRTEAWQVTPG